MCCNFIHWFALCDNDQSSFCITSMQGYILLNTFHIVTTPKQCFEGQWNLLLGWRIFRILVQMGSQFYKVVLDAAMSDVILTHRHSSCSWKCFWLSARCRALCLAARGSSCWNGHDWTLPCHAYISKRLKGLMTSSWPLVNTCIRLTAFQRK